LTKEEFARRLSAELDRELSAVPLPAATPERGLYRARSPVPAGRPRLVPAAIVASLAVLAGAFTVAAVGPGPVTQAVEGALSNLATGLQQQEKPDAHQPATTPPPPAAPPPDNRGVPAVQPQPVEPKPPAPVHTEQPAPVHTERPETPEPSEKPETPKPKQSQNPRPSPTGGEQQD
jgi:outer membrane biosynthesis protein TonB